MDIWEIYHKSFERDLNSEELDFLDTMIRKYPYFAMARFLKAKAIPTVYNIGLASAHAPSRPMFKSFMEGKKVIRNSTKSAFMQNRERTYKAKTRSQKHELFSILEPVEHEPVHIDNVPFSVPYVDGAKSYQGFLDTRVKEKMNKYHSLSHEIPQQIRSGEQVLQAKPDVRSTDSLIQAFLDKNPKIRRPSPANEQIEVKKIEDNSVEKDEEIVSETLAKIHLKQNNTGEALRIYRKLSLLFPEKSAYFDAQISAIHSK